jgi:hypothetical protein
LSELRVFHSHFSDLKARDGEVSRHDKGIQLIFTGGTCLSKAHGLINRMSEDIDIKVLLTPVEKALINGASDKVRLKALHAQIPQLLNRLGFPLLEYTDESNPKIRNSHRYYVIGAGYKTMYGKLPSLRPELKLEIIQRQPLLPVDRMEFGYLYESLAGIPSSASLSINCASVAETAAEKVISLLRRCAYKWDGFQINSDIDPALVRHIYDIACIVDLAADSLPSARNIFPLLVQNDRHEFQGQNPSFDADPLGVLRRTLKAAKSSEHLRAQYSQNLMSLVYDLAPPSFEQSFASFEAVAQDFLSAC